VTMTTIGYGDYFPRTLPGRVWSFVLCIWGVFIVSLMVVALSTFTEMNKRHKKALHLIEKMKLREELHDSASSLIGSLWRLYKVHNSTGTFKKLQFLRRMKIYRNKFNHFRKVKNHLKNFDMNTDVYDYIIIYTELIKVETSFIEEGLVSIRQGAALLNKKFQELKSLQGKSLL
jgi:Ion channel